MATLAIVFVVLPAGILGACSSSDDAPAAGTPSADAATSDAATSDAATTSGGDVDGGTRTVGDRDAAANPGKVSCGDLECGLGGANLACCIRPDGGASCLVSNGDCVGAAGFKCDDPTDCESGSACCVDLFQYGAGATAAHAACGEVKAGSPPCNDNQLELCKNDSQCHGGTCKTVTCDGRVFGSCSIPKNCH